MRIDPAPSHFYPRYSIGLTSSFVVMPFSEERPERVYSAAKSALEAIGYT